MSKPPTDTNQKQLTSKVKFYIVDRKSIDETNEVIEIVYEQFYCLVDPSIG